MGYRYLILNLILSFGVQAEIPLISISGQAQGTTYHIKYFDKKHRNLESRIDSVLNDFDRGLSLYRSDSELSEFNRSPALRYRSPYFLPVLKKSKEVYEATDGAFDPTILPLVEAYGFGPERNRNPELANIDSLRRLTGFRHISFDSLSIRKDKPDLRLDFNGIAQGYSVDVIGSLLISYGITRFMVEIGGEILCKGYKNNRQPWIAGIENPLKPGSLFCSVKLSDRAMTTAGNYRHHFEKDGRVFNHIINPKTGAMEERSLLSVTVFASDAITADGYDTAFFVMGLEETRRFLAKRKDLDVCILYTNAHGGIENFMTDGIKNLVIHF